MLVDWLPWNHVFGGTISFGIALFNGRDALYRRRQAVAGSDRGDGSQPARGRAAVLLECPEGLRGTGPVAAPRPRAAGELLQPRSDAAIFRREHRSACLRRVRRACLATRSASASHGWRLLGSTEAGLITAHGHSEAASAGCVGLPPPGVTLKLTPTRRQIGSAGSKPMRDPGLLATRRSHFRRLRRRRFSANRRWPGLGGCRKSAKRLPLRRTHRGGLQAGHRHMGPRRLAQSASLAAFDARVARRGDRRRKPALHRRLGHSILAGDCATTTRCGRGCAPN